MSSSVEYESSVCSGTEPDITTVHLTQNKPKFGFKKAEDVSDEESGKISETFSQSAPKIKKAKFRFKSHEIALGKKFSPNISTS